MDNEGKLALISSEYGVLHLFLGDGADEDLAHGVYRWCVEDLYDNSDARISDTFGEAIIGREDLQHMDFDGFEGFE